VHIAVIDDADLASTKATMFAGVLAAGIGKDCCGWVRTFSWSCCWRCRSRGREAGRNGLSGTRASRTQTGIIFTSAGANPRISSPGLWNHPAGRP